jgi:hypothetical protein
MIKQSRFGGGSHAKTPPLRRTFPLVSGCPDFESLFSILDRKDEFKIKSDLVNHIYACKRCSNNFSEYLFLSNSIHDLSADIYAHLNNRKTTLRLFHIGLSINSRISKLIFASLLCVLFFVGCLLLYNSLNDNTLLNDSILRGINSDVFSNAYPRPFSVLSRRSLYFSFPEYNSYVQWQVKLFDTGLSVIWESSISSDLFIIPSSSLLNSLKKYSYYYWVIATKTKSNVVINSDIFPFIVND